MTRYRITISYSTVEVAETEDEARELAERLLREGYWDISEATIEIEEVKHG